MDGNLRFFMCIFPKLQKDIANLLTCQHASLQRGIFVPIQLHISPLHPIPKGIHYLFVFCLEMVNYIKGIHILIILHVQSDKGHFESQMLTIEN